jgi:REP element-mobilizing transposase RayT
VVFATTERRSVIRDDLGERLHAYLGGIARENGIPALAIGGAADHVHLLLSLPRTISVAKAVQLLKSGSSKWINENYPARRNFAWQEGLWSLLDWSFAKSSHGQVHRRPSRTSQANQLRGRIEEIPCGTQYRRMTSSVIL